MLNHTHIPQVLQSAFKRLSPRTMELYRIACLVFIAYHDGLGDGVVPHRHLMAVMLCHLRSRTKSDVAAQNTFGFGATGKHSIAESDDLDSPITSRDGAKRLRMLRTKVRNVLRLFVHRGMLTRVVRSEGNTPYWQVLIAVITTRHDFA